MSTKPTWHDVLETDAPLILPSAADALTARLIELAGFPAYQIGGFALSAAMHAFPDIDLEQFAENHTKAAEIIEASNLPVLIDADDGYGDVKNVTRTIKAYERIGASALFIEDQKPPKRCGHMAGKTVVSQKFMTEKIKAAVAARSDPDFFLLARTDALESHGVDEAINRGKRYLDAGADGVYVEGPRSKEELEQVGEAFKGVPLATSILEQGGKTPWTSPSEMHAMGYDMILYPTTLLFRIVRAMQLGLHDLLSGRPLQADDAVNLDEFEKIVDLPQWADIENRFMLENRAGGILSKVKEVVTGK